MGIAKTLIRRGGCPGLSESSLGAHAILLVLSWGGSFIPDSLMSRPWPAGMLFLLRHDSTSWYWPFNPHLPGGPVHPYQLDESIPNFKRVCCTFSFLFYFEYIFLLANSEDPDQMPRSAASDLGLHCLHISQKWDARLIWVNQVSFDPPWFLWISLQCSTRSSSPLILLRPGSRSQRSTITRINQGFLFRRCLPGSSTAVPVTALMKWLTMESTSSSVDACKLA